MRESKFSANQPLLTTKGHIGLELCVNHRLTLFALRPGMFNIQRSIPVPIQPVNFGRRTRPTSSSPTIPARSTPSLKSVLPTANCAAVQGEDRLLILSRYVSKTRMAGRSRKLVITRKLYPATESQHASHQNQNRTRHEF